MGRVTKESAYRDIKNLLERGDFTTAEKLMEKFFRNLPEAQRRELTKLRRSRGWRRSFSRRLEALRRRRHVPWSIRRWCWVPALAGGAAYMAVALAWVRRLPPAAPLGGKLTGLLQGAGYWLLMFLYFFFPAFLYCTGDYLRKLRRWAEAQPEPAEVREIQQENRTGQYPRNGQVYRYQAYYAVVRLLEPRQGEPETLRFYLYENANGRYLIQGGEENVNPWSFHPGEVVTLYRDRAGFPSLTHHTRRSLTRDWLEKLRQWGGWTALFCLPLLALKYAGG